MTRTHEVFNQSEPLVGYDLFEGNLGLRDSLRLLAPQLDLAPLQALGRQLGQAEMQTHARLANSHRPVLHTHSPQGQRIDQVEFHPSYHALMSAAVAAGLHGSAWLDAGGGSHLRRAAGFMMFTELEPSVLCPISMSYAVLPALAGNAAIYSACAGKLASRIYEP
jgi:putative acyl-CoA dehydrogenase